jgi:hypothetical protein
MPSPNATPISFEKLSNITQRVSSDPINLDAITCRNSHTGDAYVHLYDLATLNSSLRGLPAPVLSIRVPGGKEVHKDNLALSLCSGLSVAASADPEGRVASVAPPLSASFWISRRAPEVPKA